MTLPLLIWCASSLATPILRATISDAMPPARTGSSGALIRQWTFCPTDRIPCDASGNPPVWVDLEVDADSFTARAKDSHDSARRILDTSAEDVKPIAEAIQRYLVGKGRSDELSQAAMVQGLVQGPLYAFDDTTGWQEYPKYTLEFIVDEQGDCDDAAIATSALLHDLNLDAWLVLWDAADDSAGGHLSSAVTPVGTLLSWRLPPGSEWISVPAAPRLLHVDGVGNTTGCSSGCAPLGWNEWKTQPKPMKVTAVVPFDSPNIDETVPIAAWADFGRRRPKQQIADRRKERPEAVLAAARSYDTTEETEEKVRAQLAGAGLTKAEASVYLDAQTVQEAGYYGISALVVAGLIAAGLGIWAEQKRRHRALARERLRRESVRF